jgi:hypothetical protein
MGRPKSFVANLTIDTAQKSHNCQHNSSHRIHMGDRRLKVKVERSNEHFCVSCAVQFLNLDIAKLKSLVDALSKPQGDLRTLEPPATPMD